MVFERKTAGRLGGAPPGKARPLRLPASKVPPPLLFSSFLSDRSLPDELFLFEAQLPNYYYYYY